MIVVAIDIGGTFTDLLGFDDAAKTFVQAKSLTTPAQLSDGIIDCIRKSGLNGGAIDELIHGSTIAINTLIERKGAKTGLIVTTGTRDVYIIGRGNRPESYNLLFPPPSPARLAADDARDLLERALASGEIYRVNARSAQRSKMLRSSSQENGVEAVAVCFLHSYANPDHERIAGEVIREALPGGYVSLSHEILREYREFERMSTTVVNAYVGPRVGGYVKSLASSLGEAGFRGNLSIMRSNGGVMSPEVATIHPVAMMESGPVGGIIAAARVGTALGYPNVISFDMGGTTAGASLIQGGEPSIAPGYYVGGYASGHPVMIPLVDIVEVGAGGGSIAWIDEVGALKVGPQSSGADPGPMCYGGGGTEPTITDANVVLGRLNPNDFLGGAMQLDAAAAERGIAEQIGAPLNLSTVASAQAIVQIAVSKMSLAVREVSVVKGFDPRDFVLVASGGAGLAATRWPSALDLHIPTDVVPLFPKHLSALGMLLELDERGTISCARTSPIWAGSILTAVAAIFDDMLIEARARLSGGRESSRQYQLDMRYVGQEFALPVPVSEEQLGAGDRATIRTAFDQLYEQRYAYHSPDEPVEMINLRLTAYGRQPKLEFPRLARSAKAASSAHRDVYLSGTAAVSTPVYRRDALEAGAVVSGPAIVQELGTTTVLFEGDVGTVADSGELIVSVGAE